MVRTHWFSSSSLMDNATSEVNNFVFSFPNSSEYRVCKEAQAVLIILFFAMPFWVGYTSVQRPLFLRSTNPFISNFSISLVTVEGVSCISPLISLGCIPGFSFTLIRRSAYDDVNPVTANSSSAILVNTLERAFTE